MKRGFVLFLTLALLLTACNKKSSVPATPTASPSPTPTGISTSVNVVLTYQGVVQNGVTVIESATYDFATNTPGATIVSGATNASGMVTLTIGNPATNYCFSANYTPAGQPAPINVANCQPTLVGISTITLGN